MGETLARIAHEREKATIALRKLQISNPKARYDLEYSTAVELATTTGVACEFSGTHYWSYSPNLLEWSFFKEVTGERPDELRILEVGAGNGDYLCALREFRGCSSHLMTGIDISGMAIIRLREKGFEAVQGTVAVLPERLRNYNKDLIFLSYFVDRDSDQRSTFEISSSLLRIGGTLVLEGLFPCVLEDSNGVSYGIANVTQGLSAEEDIGLVVAEFIRLGLKLKKRIDGERYVYSLDGPEVLPSYTLVFKKI